MEKVVLEVRLTEKAVLEGCLLEKVVLEVRLTEKVVLE